MTSPPRPVPGTAGAGPQAVATTQKTRTIQTRIAITFTNEASPQKLCKVKLIAVPKYGINLTKSPANGVA